MTKKQRVLTAKGRKVSSTHWLKRHINDPYVHRAEQEGYRSRAAFKLEEIDDKFDLISQAKYVIDMGCAPGSWMQVVQRRNSNCILIGVDLKEIESLEGAHNIISDIRDENLYDRIALLQNSKDGKILSDLILNDMAPNSCGNKQTDFLRILSLLEIVIEFCEDFLLPGGSMVSKTWRYGDMTKILNPLRKKFEIVKTFKPSSSYSDSAEIFIVCKGKL